MERSRRAAGLVILVCVGLATWGATPQRAVAGKRQPCSVRGALLSVDAVFRGLETGNGRLALSGFMQRRGDLPAWGINLEREPQLPGAKESALTAVTPAQMRRLAVTRHARGEELRILSVSISFGEDWGYPQSDRVVPLGVLYTRRADDFPNARGLGDRGGAKGSYSCTSGRIMWLRGGHGAMTKPIDESALSRACPKLKKVVECVSIPGVGRAITYDACAGSPGLCS